MKSFREVVEAIRLTQQEPYFSAPSATRRRTDFECQVVLSCSCGQSCRVSSPLGAFMSGWRKIQWEDRKAQCWECARNQTVEKMGMQP